MIYISSSCIKTKKITEAIDKLQQEGFQHIELSGGTTYYEGLEEDLQRIRQNTDLHFLLHNYFPPPKEDFVLNLASTDKNIIEKSLNHLKNALRLSASLGAKKFGFHAGFLFDPSPSELGKEIAQKKIQSREDGLARFMEGYRQLASLAVDVKLYVENNVVSKTNFQNFGINPFLLTDEEEYNNIASRYGINLLLDLAHLKVSCHVLGLNFYQQALSLIKQTDYIHISENDGKHDLNISISEHDEIWQLLKESNLDGKTITLEIYEDMDKIKKSYDLISKLL